MNINTKTFLMAYSVGAVIGVETLYILHLKDLLKQTERARDRWVKATEDLINSGYVPPEFVQKIADDIDFDMIISNEKFKKEKH